MSSWLQDWILGGVVGFVLLYFISQPFGLIGDLIAGFAVGYISKSGNRGISLGAGVGILFIAVIIYANFEITSPHTVALGIGDVTIPLFTAFGAAIGAGIQERFNRPGQPFKTIAP